MNCCEKILDEHKGSQERKEVGNDQIFRTYGKLTMECCKKVPAERKEQPGEEERDGRRAYGTLTVKCCKKVPAEREKQPGEEEGGGQRQILLTYGKLTMNRCEKVPAEREEQPGEGKVNLP
jgi:hypothetical protein